MKKTVLRCALLVVSFSFFSARMFAQAPLDPGNDPMQADSVKYIVPLEPAESNNLTTGTNLPPLKKDKAHPNKKSEESRLIKTRKKNVAT